jgi:ParB family chromosome partitioning protein
MKDVGQISPIMVTPTGLIICGHQRHRALKKAGIRTVNVVIKPILDDDHQAIEELRIEEQLRRRVLTPAQNVRTIRRWFILHGIGRGGDQQQTDNLSVRDLADALGVSDKSVFRLNRIADLIPPFMAMYDAKQLPQMMAYNIALLSKDDQTALLDPVRADLRELTIAAVQDYRKQAETHAVEVERLTVERDLLRQQLDASPDADARIAEIEERLETIQAEKAREIAALSRKVSEQDESIQSLTTEAKRLEGALAQQQRALSFRENDRVHKWLSHAEGLPVVNPGEYAAALRADPMLNMFIGQHIDKARIILSWVSRYLACLEASDAEEPENVRRMHHDS